MKPLRTVLLTPFLFAVAVAAPPASAQPAPEAVRAALDTLLADLHRRGWFDGALVAGRGDTILYARGFGLANREADVPFTPRTPSDGGSIAKTFTAAAVLMLEEGGLLSLDDPVQRYLPEYPYAGTTVRHLITHRTGGLPDYDYFWGQVGAGEVLTNERLLGVLHDRRPPLPYAPGVRFVYDSPAFDLAALVVERVAARPYPEFLRERVLAPLGIDSLFARPARFSDWPGVRTMSYRREGDSLVVHDVWDREGFHGGSNLYLSADDLYRWVTSFYARPVLGPEALAEGLGPVVLDDGRETGINLLSWYADEGRRRFHYSGVLQGFYAVGYWDAGRGVAFAYVTNTDTPQGVRPLLTAAVAAALATGRPSDVDPPEGAPLGDGYPDAVAGAYALDDGETVRFAVDDGALFVRVAEGPAYRAVRMDPATLYVPGLDAWVTFGERDGGRFRCVRRTTVFAATTGARME